MILTIANEKGGVGKTTIAFQTAVALAHQSRDVLLVDADPQGSSSDVSAVRASAEIRPPISCIRLLGKSLAIEVRKLKTRYQDIVIDVGGRDTAALRASLVVSDKVIIPVLPAQLDAWTLETMDELVEQAQGFNSMLEAHVLLNKVDPNPRMRLADSVAEFVAELPNLELLNNKLTYRVSHRRSLAKGQAVNEINNPDPKAVAELNALFAEIYYA